MRRPHLLRHNRGTELPNALVFVDTETHERKRGQHAVSHHLSFGWACFTRTRVRGDWTSPSWCRFTSRRSWWDWLEARARNGVRLYVFAHNWAFDAPVLGVFTELPRRGWMLRKAIIESPPVVLDWRRGRASITFIDTLNYWRLPLREVGRSVDLPKLPMPPRGAPKAEWDAYGRRDVEIIHRAVTTWIAFLQEHDLGSFAPTIASQAMRAFRHRFMKHPILIDDNPHALQLARESYHGGRVECFRLGHVEGPIHCLDVNSMYPYVMREHVYPSVLRLHCARVEPQELERWLEGHCVTARVRLETKAPRYPVVHEGRLVFPVGRLQTTLTTPDLQHALQADEIRSIDSASVYDRAPLFREFVDTLYGLRCAAQLAGDEVQSWLLKKLLNSLYGKWAQKGQVWEITHATLELSARTWRELDYETGHVERWRQFGGVVQRYETETESRDSSPAIAAHVTSFARELLWTLILRAGRDHVLYCDTDSLFVDDRGRQRLEGAIDAAELGQLKQEWTAPWIELRGAKDYRTPMKDVTKGVRCAAEWTGPNTLIQERWRSLVGLLSVGDLDAPTTERREKVLQRVYQKGELAHDGRVLPLRLEQW